MKNIIHLALDKRFLTAGIYQWQGFYPANYRNSLQLLFMRISYKVSSDQSKPIYTVQHGSYVKLSTFTQQSTKFQIDFDINLYGLSQQQVTKYAEVFAKEHNKTHQLQKALKARKQQGDVKFIWGFLSLITDGCYKKGYQRSRSIINQNSAELQRLFYQGLLSKKPSTVTISGKGVTRPSQKTFVNIELLHINTADKRSLTIISTPNTNSSNGYQLEDSHLSQIQTKQVEQTVQRYCSLPPIYKKQNNFNLQTIQNTKNISDRFPTNEQAASLLSQYHQQIKTAKEQNKNGPKVSRISIALPTERQFLNDSQYKSKLWPNGTIIKYSILQPRRGQRYINGYEREIAAVDEAFRIWKNTGLNLSFQKTNNPAEAHIRIAFLNQGSYSYIGTDCLGIPRNEHTMNFGWNRIGQDGTAIHEIGHALGLYHEHQNPYCPIVWNEQNVIDSLINNGNDWPIQQIRSNIFDKIPVGAAYSSQWDSTSIMHYNFDASNIQYPQYYRINGIPRNTKLSKLDVDYIKRAYPIRVGNLQEISRPEQIEKTFHQICTLLGENKQKQEQGQNTNKYI